jgi:hypothetical protein
MSAFEAGAVLDQFKLTLKGLVLEQPWGELWRAEHEKHGAVLFAAYSGARGEAHFSATRARIAQWNRRSEVFPGLSPILEEHGSSAIPVLILQDPGGGSLREKVAGGPLGVADASQMAKDVAAALAGLAHEGIGPIGLTADHIHLRSDFGFVIVPYALLDAAHPETTGAAQWLPPELKESRTPDSVHADVYAATLLTAGAILGDVEHAPSAASVRAGLPYKRLGLVLSNGVAARNGAYTEPKTTALLLDRYRKTEMASDLADAKEAVAATTRSPMAATVHANRAPLILAGKIAGVVAVLALLVFGIMSATKGGPADSTPRGLSRVYFEALIARDATAATAFTEGEGTSQTHAILADIKRMEDKHLTSKFGSVNSPRMGDANASKIQAKTTLLGEAGDPFMEVEFVVEKKGEHWKVVGLLFKPMRE